MGARRRKRKYINDIINDIMVHTLAVATTTTTPKKNLKSTSHPNFESHVAQMMKVNAMRIRTQCQLMNMKMVMVMQMKNEKQHSTWEQHYIPVIRPK